MVEHELAQMGCSAAAPGVKRQTPRGRKSPRRCARHPYHRMTRCSWDDAWPTNRVSRLILPALRCYTSYTQLHPVTPQHRFERFAATGP